MLHDTEPLASSETLQKQGEPSCDFDWEGLSHSLGETDEHEPSRSDLALAVSKLFTWILDVDLRRGSSVNLIGRRMIAMAWVMDPKRFDGASLRKLTKQMGMTPAQLSEYAADVSRVFGISNKFQAHDSKKEKVGK